MNLAWFFTYKLKKYNKITHHKIFSIWFFGFRGSAYVYQSARSRETIWIDARAVIYVSQLFNSEIIERAVPNSAHFVSFFISPAPSIDNYAIAIRARSQ